MTREGEMAGVAYWLSGNSGMYCTTIYISLVSYYVNERMRVT